MLKTPLPPNNLAPFDNVNPFTSKTAIVFPEAFFISILPFLFPLPPRDNISPSNLFKLIVPAFIRLAFIVPAVIKSATIAPFIVIAVPYGPLIPVELYPNPFTFHLHTFLAVFVLSVSIIKISFGLKTTYPVVAFKINSVASFWAVNKISLLIVFNSFLTVLDTFLSVSLI